MSEENNSHRERRHSHALDPELITDPLLLAEAEAANGLRQFDIGCEIAKEALERGAFKLRVSTILTLHREALRGISRFAGNFRPGDVQITQSKHSPPAAHLVPGLVEEMCDYVNENWESRSALHLSSYLMWRLNWIHPFADGNGRTSRIASYLVLLIKSGSILPGIPTIPDQIVGDRRGYFSALDHADEAFRSGVIDLSHMESLLRNMLAKQLMGYIDAAGQSSAT